MILPLAAAVLASTAPPPTPSPAPVGVVVTRNGDSFTAEFRLPRSAPAWGFFRSANARIGNRPWRQASWQVLTPGVQLVRRGRYDALVAAAGRPVPRTVRVRLKPFTGDLISDYLPALALGPTGIALFDGHFALFSVGSRAELDKLPADLADTPVGDSGTLLRFRNPRGSLRLAGDLSGYQSGNSLGTYGLFDVPKAIDQDDMATVVDMRMPTWLADDIRSFTPRLLATYRRQLGDPGSLRPTVLASWAGAEEPGVSLNGGVLKGLVLMRLSGQQTLTADPRVRSAAHRFLAHESAHFWLGQAVDFERTADSWIMEGGADFLAIRATAAMDPAFDARRAVQGSLDRCLPASARGGVASAAERNDNRAFYDCGAILALVAEKASGGDFGAFVRRMLAGYRGRKISGADWLRLLDEAAPGRSLGRLARPLLAEAQPTPKGWTDLLTAAGIGFRLRPDQTPELQ